MAMTTIYFATNRLLLPPDNPDVFGKGFSEDGLANLRFGRAEVTGVDFNEFEIYVEPENLAPDPAERRLGSLAVFEQIQQEMRQEGKDTVIFIHGFNVSFKEALRQGARLHQVLTAFNPFDTGEPLNLDVFVFSWPSDASLLFTDPRYENIIAYQNDRIDAAASGVAFGRGFLKLADFIQELNRRDRLRERCLRRLNLVAHSMGNYVLRFALHEIKRQRAERVPRLFEQILMMAADEDDDAFDFADKLLPLPYLTRRTSVYFNRGDIALWASDVFKGNTPRLGTDGPFQPRSVPRSVYPIDCTEVVEARGDATEHNYYLEVPRVIADMRWVLQNQNPDAIIGREFLVSTNRFRLSPLAAT
jgi:esterase/lipase superfamily enzyme